MTFWRRLRARFWDRKTRPRREVHASVPQVPAAMESLAACANCIHFRNDPATIEAAIPGLATLSSGDASVRAGDGLCLKHDRFVTPRSSCRFFRALRLNSRAPLP